MAKKAPAKRKPNPFEDPLTKLADRLEKINKPPAKRKSRPKNRVDVAGEKLAKDPPKTKPVAWRSWLISAAKIVALIGLGVGGGIWSAGGIEIGPEPVVFNDSLSEAHKADRATQVRILREYVGKTFGSEPEAQAWLNAQRIEARKTDWIPYTDELGAAADSGVDAVKKLADKLEGKR